MATPKKKWVDEIAETPLPEAFSLPGPYQMKDGAIAAADGATLVGWTWGGNRKRQLVAANHRTDILATLEALSAAAADQGIDLTVALDRNYGPDAELVQLAGRKRSGSASLANADPHKAFSLAPGALAKHRPADRDVGLFDWTRKGEYSAHSFRSIGDAMLLADSLDKLVRLDAALMRLKAEPRASLSAPLAAALDTAEALSRATLRSDEVVRYNEAMRKISHDRPYGPNGFLNPYYEGTGTDHTWLRLSERRDPETNERKHLITASWLTWQGTEWEVEFPSKDARDTAVVAIFQRYAEDKDKAVFRRDKWELARERGISADQDDWHRKMTQIEDHQKRVNTGEFWRDCLTLRPDMIADLLPADAIIRFTPTSLKARQQMVKLGVDCFNGKAVAVSPADLTALLANPLTDPTIAAEARAAAERQAAAEAAAKEPKVLFRNDKFVVTDHREKGVEVQFRTVVASGDDQGSKWFLEAAADQVRSFFQSDQQLRGRMLRELEDKLTRRLDIAIAMPLR